MQEANLKEFEEMWTTKLDRHVLVDNRQQSAPNGQKRGISIFELRQGQLLYVLIEDNEMAKVVSQRMLEAGVRVMSDVKEALALARTQVDKPDINNNGAMGKTA